MSRGDRKSACPPSCQVPTSKDTRVRVEAFMKIIASDLPASGMRSYRPSRIASASRKRDSSSSLEKSGMARKSRCKTGGGGGEGRSWTTSYQLAAASEQLLEAGYWLLAA